MLMIPKNRSAVQEKTKQSFDREKSAQKWWAAMPRRHKPCTGAGKKRYHTLEL